MKKIFLLVALVVGSMSVSANSKLDLHSLCQLRQYQSQSDSKLLGQTETKTVTAIVKLSSDDAFEAEGVEVLRQRGDLAVVRIPMDKVDAVCASSKIRQMNFQRPLKMKLDAAHASTGVDKVHAGTDLNQAYTGAGVLVSCTDQGIDPNHITFRKAGTTESRVKRVWTVNNAKLTAYDTASKISSFTSDDTSETHGTHVMGIATGSYTDDSIVYPGVATGADIAMVGLKTSTDADIILGIETLIDYANTLGEPLVVNISLGENSGPHDGTSATSQYFARLGKEAIICIAAGNEADLSIAAHKTFTSDDNATQGLFTALDSYYYGDALDGTCEFYSDSDETFSLTPVIVSSSNGKVLYQFDTIDGSSSYSKTYRASSSTSMSKYFSGSFQVTADIDDESGRYGVAFEFTNCELASSTYRLGYMIQGSAGRQVWGYADAYYVGFDTSVKGWYDDVDADGSINSMACCDNIIAVGAYTTKNSVRRLDGTIEKDSDSPVNDIAYFSSYGTLVDGRTLPHVCAPGNIIVSAYSTPYMKTQARQDGSTISKYTSATGKVAENGKYYFWDTMSGTSMSTPYMAGTAALWLEANPKLTVSDIINVINETSTSDSYVKKGNAVQWGAGKLNAYEGLKKVLQEADGVNEVNSDKNLLVRSLGGNSYEVFVADENALEASVYDLSGRKVAAASADSNTVVVNLDGQQKGVYVINVAGKSTRYAKKVMVK